MAADAVEKIIDEGPMTWRQWAVIAITIFLNALDGFDVLSISFAAPGITREWGLAPQTLGWLLSMELIGMAAGSLLLGGATDRWGRKPMIIACLTLMSFGMYLAGHASGFWELLVWRLVTGLGIGGLISAISAVAAETANRKWRSLALSLMVIGYPLGGVFGGLIVRELLLTGGWRDIFTFGAIVTALMIPVVLMLLPETPAFLGRNPSQANLEKVNASLRKLGHDPVEALSVTRVEKASASVFELFSPGMLRATVLITGAYLLHVTSYYYLLKWAPNISVQLGYDARTAASLLSWISLGGAVGGAFFGLLAVRFGLRSVTIVTLFCSFAFISLLATGGGNLTLMVTLVALAGFFANSGIAAFYALFADTFPTHLRATGTGVAIGIGRGGAALAPVLAGYLFAFNVSLGTVSLVLGAGSLGSALLLMLMRGRRSAA